MLQLRRTVAVVGLAYVCSVTGADTTEFRWSEDNVQVFSTRIGSSDTCFLANRAADGTRINIVRHAYGTVLDVAGAGALKKVTVKLPDGDKSWDIGGTKDMAGITGFAADLFKAVSSRRTVTVVVEGADKTVSADYPGTTAIAKLNACVRQAH